MSEAKSSNNTTKIYRLNPHELPNVGVFVFVGRTGSGKTSVMEDILSYKRHRFHRAVIMTGSPGAAKSFRAHFPFVFIHDCYDEALLQDLLNKQERDDYFGRCKPLLVVLDDLGYMAKDIQKSEVIKRIFMAGRHFKILLLLSMQYCKSFLPDLRTNVSYIFSCFEKNPTNRRRIYEAYNTIFPAFAEFDKVMLSCTQNHEVMVLSNTFSQSTAVSDNVFWYKASYPPQPWKLNNGGSIWRYHARHFDPMYFTKPKPDAIKKGRRRKSSEIEKSEEKTFVVTKAARPRHR
jgi:hypothetical protein